EENRCFSTSFERRLIMLAVKAYLYDNITLLRLEIIKSQELQFNCIRESAHIKLIESFQFIERKKFEHCMIAYKSFSRKQLTFFRSNTLSGWLVQNEALFASASNDAL